MNNLNFNNQPTHHKAARRAGHGGGHDLTLRVAHLPALTWNRLGVNDAGVSIDLGETLPLVSAVSGHDRPGIDLQTADSAGIKAALDAFGTGERERVIAGKTAIYAEQAVATGLGAEFEAFMDGHARGYILTFSDTADRPVIFDTAPEGSAALNEEKGDILLTDRLNAVSQIIKVSAGCEATVIDVVRGDDGQNGFAARLVRAHVGRGAKCHLIRVCLAGDDFTVMDDTGAVLEEDAVFDYTRVIVGTGRCYAGCAIDQRGDRSSFHFDCAYDLAENDLLEMNDVTVQRGRDTESTMRLHGVLSKDSEKTFRGTIDFRSGSAGSTGDQEEDVLLLDDAVINKSMPIILCEEEDVEGRHAASIGRLSEDILFYLKTRGIDEETARRLMVAGKVGTVVRRVPSETVRAAVTASVDALN